MSEVVTLFLAGKPLTFTTRVEGCKPPYVPRAQPGVCPGSGKAKKSAGKIAKAVVGRKKAVAESQATDKAERTKKAYQAVIKIAAGEKFSAEPDLMPEILEILKDVPPMNLKMMQVEGKGNENLFQHALRDIPRDKMPALPDTVEGLQPLMDELTRRGVKFELVDVDPRELQAIQTELSAPKVAKMAGFMKNGWKEGGAMVISKEGAVGDGHHRWAGAAMAAMLHAQGVEGYKPVRVKALKIDLGVDDMLAIMEEFSGPKKSIKEAP